MHRAFLRERYPSGNLGEDLARLDDNDLLLLMLQGKLDFNEYFAPPHLMAHERRDHLLDPNHPIVEEVKRPYD